MKDVERSLKLMLNDILLKERKGDSEGDDFLLMPMEGVMANIHLRQGLITMARNLNRRDGSPFTYTAYVYLLKGRQGIRMSSKK